MSGPARKRALLIGVGTYADSRFAGLPCALADLRDFSSVLLNAKVGSFDDVQTVVDPDSATFRQAVHDFLDRSVPDELALVYFSGHGVRAAATAEFHFVTADTRSDRLEQTGVSAGFLNTRLDDCRAGQRVVIIDSCQSGGFVTGFQTRDVKGAGGSAGPLATRGVIVLSSSRAVESSFAGADPGGPSLFTGEIITSLGDGSADLDQDGWVAVTELHHHVNARLRALDRSELQTPVISLAGVDGPIYLAKAPLRPAGRRPRPGVTAAPDGELAPRKAGPGDDRPPWPRLLQYYRECVQGENSDAAKLMFPRNSRDYVCVPGVERLLSGAGSDQDGLLPVPEEVAPFVEHANKQQLDLVYGYPVVVLHQDRDKQPLKVPLCAPLLIRRLEVVHHEQDGLRLRPYGEPEPNPVFAQYWLGEEEAEHLRQNYRPGWGVGDHDLMVKDIRFLLGEDFALELAQELRPECLAAGIDVAAPVNGARNAAVISALEAARATKNLLEDLEKISAESARIRGTSLGSLLEPLPPADSDPQVAPVAVVPLNAAQARVLNAAMSRRLTVATGPPGTGKSALVVNVVATAVAAGQKVLLASTNNQAVDEVWRRCSELVPGLVVRTGSSSAKIDYRQTERRNLQELLDLPVPAVNSATAKARHSAAARDHSAVSDTCDTQALTERDLLTAGAVRAGAGARLPAEARGFVARVHQATDPELERWRSRGSRLAKARLFGAFRRNRFLRSLQLSADPASVGGAVGLCAEIGAYTEAEQKWRKLRALPQTDDADLVTRLNTAEQALQQASVERVRAAVAEAARSGRSKIQALLALGDWDRQKWPRTRDALAAAPAWAVSCLSARRFPPDPGLFDLVVIDEASQCSIPAVLPLLFRAKRALIIGDPLQLRHIAGLQPQLQAQITDRAGLSADWLIERNLVYRDHSSFHALERAAGGSILLDEHYRCHPQIARLANTLFYAPRDKPLTILTDPGRQRKVPAMPAATWIDSPGKAFRGRSGSWANRTEADRVTAGVTRLLAELPPSATIGVVTPFAAQAALLQKHWEHEPDRVRVGTVHRFQGGECDAVIFSLVAAQDMSPGTMRFLEENPNLWNVAITRARAHLFVVGGADYWRGRGGLGQRLLAELTDRSGQAAAWPHGEQLRDLLFDRLGTDSPEDVRLCVPCAGYTADALVTAAEGEVAVLLDGGAPGPVRPSRHLQLQLKRLALLADPGEHRAAVRVPAWRLYDEDWRFVAAAYRQIG